MKSDTNKKRTDTTRQFATFYLGDDLYGINVMQVQEVTKSLPMTLVRLAPEYVRGLINLRGQISTAIGLKELFNAEKTESENAMAVVCRIDDCLISFLVDRIGDVMEVRDDLHEAPPETIPPLIRRFLNGVYKTEGPLLSVIEVEKIATELNKKV